MLSKPKNYIEHVMSPMVRRFIDEPSAIDLAIASCIVISQIVDVLKEHGKRDQKDISNEVINVTLAFAIVRSVAEAAKHVEITYSRHGPLKGLRIDDMHLGAEAAFTDGTYFSDGTSWSDSIDVVRIELPNGDIVNLSYLAHSVAQALEDKYAK